MNYLAPVSYAKFLRDFSVEEQKSFFPYEWFDSMDKLEHPSLPCYEAFYSPLKQRNVLEEKDNEKDQRDIRIIGREHYATLEEAWKENSMETFRDFLIYYNNLDVVPFVKAITWPKWRCCNSVTISWKFIAAKRTLNSVKWILTVHIWQSLGMGIYPETAVKNTVHLTSALLVCSNWNPKVIVWCRSVQNIHAAKIWWRHRVQFKGSEQKCFREPLNNLQACPEHWWECICH